MIGPAALVLLVAGLLAMAIAGAGLVAMHNRYDRLHFIAVAATVGTPLIGAALALDIGLAAPTAKVLIIVAVTALSAPVASAATGFAMRRREKEESQ